jgi:tight adherence protein B
MTPAPSIDLLVVPSGVVATTALVRSATALALDSPTRRRLAGVRPPAVRRSSPAPPTAPTSAARRSRLERALADAAVVVDPNQVRRKWAAATIGLALVALLVGGVGLAAASVLFMVAGPWLWLRSQAGRGAALLELALPDALEVAARSLRAGSSLRGALGEASRSVPDPLADDLRAIVVATDRGESLGAAVDAWVARRPDGGARLTGAAIGLAADAGGGAARALDSVAATLRDRMALGRELRALSAQARLSAAVIAVAPIGFAGLAVGLDGSTAEFLLRTTPGLGCLVGGLALDGLGAWWMTRITRSVS